MNTLDLLTQWLKDGFGHIGAESAFLQRDGDKWGVFTGDGRPIVKTDDFEHAVRILIEETT